MDPHAAEVAFTSHMLRARSQDGVDPKAALAERRHALTLAERFGGPQQVAEACGALCWSETVAFGAPVTARFVEKGIEVARSNGLYLDRFLLFEALFLMEIGELDAADERFTEALASASSPIADVRIGLGTLALRRADFEQARQQFELALDDDRVDDLTPLRALDGQGEAERHLGDDRAATASASRMLELTALVDVDSDRVLRRYRTRALNALGLLRWRAGAPGDALRYFRSALELWPDRDAKPEAGALIALERAQLLRRAPGSVPPAEASSGHGWAVGFLLLGQDPLTPVNLTESPPSLERVEQLRGLRSGDRFDEGLWPVLGEDARDAWFVSRVRPLRAARCLLVDLVPNEGVPDEGGR